MVAPTHKTTNGRQRIDYKEAERMLRSGSTQKEVAERYGVTQSAVSEAIDRGAINFKYDDATTGKAMPWSPIQPQHRHKYLARMLRAAHRRSQGKANNEKTEQMLDQFLAAVKREDFVVHYNPNTEEGFFRVPRREGVDQGLVREPGLDAKGKPVVKKASRR